MSDDHDLLTELNVKMDNLSEKLVTHLEASEKLHNRQCIRLDALEQWKWRWVGATAVLVLPIDLPAVSPAALRALP